MTSAALARLQRRLLRQPHRPDDRRPADDPVRPPRRLLPGAAVGGRVAVAARHDLRPQVEFRGVENIPQGGYIIAAKHQSFLETFALLAHAPDFAIILKQQLIVDPVVRALSGRRPSRSPSTVRAAAPRCRRSSRKRAQGARRRPADLSSIPRARAGRPARRRATNTASRRSTPTPARPACRSRSTPASSGAGADFTRRPGVAVIEYLPPIPPGLDRDALLAEASSAIETGCERLNAEALARDPTLAPTLRVGGPTPPRRSEALRGGLPGHAPRTSGREAAFQASCHRDA